MSIKITDNDVDPETTTPHEYTNVLLFVGLVVLFILVCALSTFKSF